MAALRTKEAAACVDPETGNVMLHLPPGFLYSSAPRTGFTTFRGIRQFLQECHNVESGRPVTLPTLNPEGHRFPSASASCDVCDVRHRRP